MPPSYFMNGAAKDCVTLAEGTWENGACINAQDMPPWSTDKTAAKALAYYLNEGAVSVDDHGWLKEGESLSSPYHPCGYQSGFMYGIEYMGIKELIVNFNDGSTGTMCGSRSRTIDCPIDTYPSIDNGECQCPGACFEDETCPAGNPTLPASGVKIHREDLITANGVNTLPLSLSYRSRYAAVTNYEINDGAWRHNYQSAVYSRGIWWNWNGSHYVQSYSTYVMRPNGAAYRFEQKEGSSAWTSIETDDTLTQTASGWRLKLAHSDAIETYNANGKLVSIQQRNGLKTTLKYDTQGQLIRVTHPYGRFLTFKYDNAWHLTRINTSDGEHYRLAYDANGNLSSITYPDQRSRQFHYESTQHPNALTGVTDEAGQRIGTYSYHTDGRVFDTQRANAVDHLQFAYAKDAQGLPQTHVTRFTAQGSAEQQTYNFITRGHVTRPANISLPAGQSGYAQQTEYDAKGHKNKVITHDGRVTFYTYNSKGRITREATYPASDQNATTAPPPGKAESVTLTQWHGRWNLPLKTAEAYLITSYSYDSKGNLLELIETPTTDATGAKGFNATPSGTTYTTRWTYDAKNLPTTIVEMVGSTETGRWTLAYNSTGDVTRIDNLTAGTFATMSQYDAQGRMLEGVAEGGIPVSVTYDARGHVTSITREGKRMTFVYDARGLFTQANFPTGDVITLSYDSNGQFIEAFQNGVAISTTLHTSQRSAPSPTFFARPFYGTDTSSCAYYSQACEKNGGYACYAQYICPIFPTGEENDWWQCVRQCLQEEYKRREDSSGNFCPVTDNPYEDHKYCFLACAINSGNPGKLPGTPPRP